MHQETIIRCPNCGNYAERFLSDYLPTGDNRSAEQVLQTECMYCDYFMVMCVNSGRVHLPSLAATTASPSSHNQGKDWLLSR